jgi:hypothetical protein
MTALVLTFAAPADAVLVYQRAGVREIVAARDDGSHPHVIAHGIDPIVSPNGRWVLFGTPRRADADLKLVRIEGGRVHFLMHNFPACGCGLQSLWLRQVWSPDSRYVLAYDASDGITQLIDLVQHTRRERGCSGSFSPDVARIAIGCDDVTPYSETRTLSIYNIHNRSFRGIGSGDLPLWGTVGLAFTREKGLVLERKIGGHARLLVPNPSRTPFLYPVDWSLRGRTLLAADGREEFKLKALLVTLVSGRVVTLGPTFSEVDALSRRGRWVLGVTGGNVVAMRTDGSTRILARHAVSASWTK